MLSIINTIFNRRSYPLNQIVISKKRLLDNYKYLSKVDPKVKIAPVLKSNAYGHGIEHISKILDAQAYQDDRGGAPFFCVDSLFEAYQLLKVGVKSEILIMGYVDPRSLMAKKLPFSYAIWDLDYAKVINEHQKGAEVHAFVDTGMHREGVQIRCQRSDIRCQNFQDCLLHFIEEVKKLTNIKIVGLMTHLAMADKPSNPLTLEQLENFKTAQKIFKKQNVKTRWQHIGGGIAALTIKNPPCNLIRAGKVLYGVGARHLELVSRSGSRNKFGMTLKPVLRLTTKIAQIKEIRLGDKVGYNGTFSAKKKMLVGILPIGYNDGVDRRLSNKGFVLVNKRPCKILGRVSMNLTTIDLSNVANPKVGNEVIVFSDSPEDPNSIENAAKTCKTIPYDLMVHLATSTKRQII